MSLGLCGKQTLYSTLIVIMLAILYNGVKMKLPNTFGRDLHMRLRPSTIESLC